MDSKKIIEQFLSFPISSADDVMTLFEQLPGAIVGKGEGALERFVYIPGTRKDRVLLVAHADTVWDEAYGNPCRSQWKFENGVYYSINPQCGIGADDRSGCAMLWALRDCGHSILVVSGEEKGKHGAKYLRDRHKALFSQLNKHQFMIEMDWAGTGGCLYNQVDNTNYFKKYIEDVLGFSDSKAKGGCDLQILCRRVCGVNVGVGFHYCHSSRETLVLSEWENTYSVLRGFLQKPQPRFLISPHIRLIRFLQRVKTKLGRILKIRK